MVLIGFFILVVSFLTIFCILSYFIFLFDAKTFAWHQLVHNGLISRFSYAYENHMIFVEVLKNHLFALISWESKSKSNYSL